MEPSPDAATPQYPQQQGEQSLKDGRLPPISPRGRDGHVKRRCQNREVETIPSAVRRDFPLKNRTEAPITSLNVVTGPPAWRVK
jgi:hypothetical protein